MMIDAHIHRVPFLDERGRPVGIVSSTDVLAAVMREGRRSAKARRVRATGPSK
jgi:CBS domain-containing protein